MWKFKQKSNKGEDPKMENNFEDSRKGKKASITEAW